VLVGLAAGLLVVLGVSRLLVHAPSSSAGRDASIMEDSATFEALMTENAFTAADEDRCSRPGQGIGFYCGYVPASLLASR
jgi:hypothetical protein